MLFMGEEWGSSSPFQFFSSHPEPELARATAEGRKRSSPSTAGTPTTIPDPQDPETFQRSKLNWDEIDDGDHARLRRVLPGLIALRRNEPDMADPWLDHLRVDYDEDAALDRHAPRLRWRSCATWATTAVDVPVTGEVVLAWGEPVTGADSTRLGGHSVAILRAVN